MTCPGSRRTRPGRRHTFGSRVAHGIARRHWSAGGVSDGVDAASGAAGAGRGPAPLAGRAWMVAGGAGPAGAGAAGPGPGPADGARSPGRPVVAVADGRLAVATERARRSARFCPGMPWQSVTLAGPGPVAERARLWPAETHRRGEIYPHERHGGPGPAGG